ncbi:MAG: antitoxin [Mycoplasmataceae bacterium RC_NB112A]|nr:MAG: antitoxin [Mycoplasmataceae bacterium RC_NB112A]KLL01961.1 MAG: antitoxin [Mycoplasmataceae bacterium RC_NB112A]KLL01974.1 MAG: antitoxin [Mycoplasmataceae bacterium RC_NB112A]
MTKELPVYEIVMVIGVDGVGRFYEQAKTPTLDNFFKDGIYWRNAKAVTPTESAENWGSLLHGVLPEKHKLTNGIVESGKPYDENSIYPSIFKIISHSSVTKINEGVVGETGSSTSQDINKSANNKLEMASYVSWEPINTAIIEESVEMERYAPLTNEWFFWRWWMLIKHKWLKNSIYDYFTISRLVDYIKKLDDKGKKFIFVHLTDTDEHGHDRGFGSNGHLKQIGIMDDHLKTIFEAIEEKKKGEWKDKRILVLITTDHGGINHEDGRGTHGGRSEEEINVFLTVKGDLIDKAELEDEECNMNSAAVILKALGAEIPKNLDTKLPIYLSDKKNT